MKPLLITDCDEVLLHMVRHFGDWLGEAHRIDFDLTHHDWGRAMRPRDGRTLTPDEMWGYLDGFFPAQMARQTLVPHAREALAELAKVADIVVLTNLQDHCQAHRVAQLAEHGIEHRVVCNQGGKGRPVAQLAQEHDASVVVFVDDLPQHHESVARAAPQVHRLHMVSEPKMAAHVPAAPHAHARIDDWRDALAWIEARFAAGTPADNL